MGCRRKKNILLSVTSSVVDPDPYVFGHPGSEYQQAKIARKTSISTVLWLVYVSGSGSKTGRTLDWQNRTLSDPTRPDWEPVLRIRNILRRIRILGSVRWFYGTESGSSFDCFTGSGRLSTGPRYLFIPDLGSRHPDQTTTKEGKKLLSYPFLWPQFHKIPKFLIGR